MSVPGKEDRTVLGEGGLIARLTERVVERALAGVLAYHLGYEKGQKPQETANNHRNGYSRKKVWGGDGDVEIPLRYPCARGINRGVIWWFLE